MQTQKQIKTTKTERKKKTITKKYKQTNKSKHKETNKNNNPNKNSGSTLSTKPPKNIKLSNLPPNFPSNTDFNQGDGCPKTFQP